MVLSKQRFFQIPLLSFTEHGQAGYKIPGDLPAAARSRILYFHLFLYPDLLPVPVVIKHFGVFEKMTINRFKIGLGSFSVFLLALILLLSSFLTGSSGLNKARNYYVPPYAYLDIISGNFRNLTAQMFLICSHRYATVWHTSTTPKAYSSGNGLSKKIDSATG